MIRHDLRCVHVRHLWEAERPVIGAGVTRKAVLRLVCGCSEVESMLIGFLTYATPRRAFLAARLGVRLVSYFRGQRPCSDMYNFRDGVSLAASRQRHMHDRAQLLLSGKERREGVLGKKPVW